MCRAFFTAPGLHISHLSKFLQPPRTIKWQKIKEESAGFNNLRNYVQHFICYK